MFPADFFSIKIYFRIVMSEGGDAKTSGIPISELGVEQISALQRQVEQELTFFQESANQLKVS